MAMAVTLRQRYDSREGIAEMIRTLAGLNELSRLRQEAGYSRGDRLSEFVILGRWMLDTCGNMSKILGEFIPKEKFPDIPDVMTRDEFWTFLRRKVRRDVSISSTPEGFVPPVRITCAECGRPWSIKNAHDLVARRESPIFPLDDFVGMTLAEVRSFLESRTDAVWWLRIEKPIRHDRFIDLTPHPKYETLKINERGWAGKNEGITDEYVIQGGDESAPDVWRCFHSVCNRVSLERIQREKFVRVFENAGLGSAVLTMTAIPNQYCRCDLCTPWFEVSTTYGVIVIGWRKRVINIDWSATGIVAPVPDDEVTCGEGWTHAWGEDKATEYLTKIRLAAEAKV
jgi:hypothetical protein